MSGNVQMNTQKVKTGCVQVWWKCASELNTDANTKENDDRDTSDNKIPTTLPLFT
jgi:hypothetical protein